MEGALSDSIVLMDMVFQGTVLGPALWNAFFADIAVEVPCNKQGINLFADDQTVMTTVPQNVADHILLDELQQVQGRTQACARKNQVDCDSANWILKIIHLSLGQGDVFKLPSTLFDCALSMMHVLKNCSAKQGL